MFTKIKDLTHDIFEDDDMGMKLHDLQPLASDSDILLHYTLESRGKTQHSFIVWNVVNDFELTSFHECNTDLTYQCYLNGARSRLGYIIFDKYIVNLDFCLPNPFSGYEFHMVNSDINCQGYKINTIESVCIQA